MVSWRLWLVALAALSMVPAAVRGQVAPGLPGAAAAPEPASEPSDDDGAPGSPGAGSGSAQGPVVPADPKARVTWLGERFTTAVVARPVLSSARVAYAVVDLGTGNELVARQADQRMNLASNAKLLTAIAALSGLGSGFRWRTAVFGALPDAAGLVTGDLYVRGRGDPTLTIAGLRQLAADVAARGVRAVEGKLVIDGSYFDADVEPPRFSDQPKERAAYRAPVASFAVNHSAVQVTVMAEPTGPARVTLEPASDSIKLGKVEVQSVTTGRSRLRVEPRVVRDVVELDVSGVIRVGEGSWDLRRRVDDPQRFAAEVFRRALVDNGVKLRGGSGARAIATGTVPPTAKLLAVRDSAPLTDVVRAMNKHSDNNVAEHIFKTLGAELKGRPGPATWTDATNVLGAQLAKLGLAPGSYRASNGSGLYAATEVSAKQLLGLLAAAHRDYRISPDLVGSLPAGGVDGTLARRWVGKPAMGRVRAKTGTLDKVITLAGYVGVEGGRLIGFAILVNDIPVGQRPQVRAMMDDMVDALAAYLGG